MLLEPESPSIPDGSVMNSAVILFPSILRSHYDDLCSLIHGLSSTFEFEVKREVLYLLQDLVHKENKNLLLSVEKYDKMAEKVCFVSCRKRRGRDVTRLPSPLLLLPFDRVYPWRTDSRTTGKTWQSFPILFTVKF